MSSLASEMPFYNLNTAEFYNEISNRYDSIFTNCDLKDFIGKIDVIHDINQLNFDYLIETEFNCKFASNVENGVVALSLFHVNIRSLNANHRKLCQFLQLLCIHFDIVVLSEIWSSNINFYSNILPGYKFYYALPLRGTIGGVGIFVNNTLDCSENVSYCINSTDSVRVENIWLNVQKNNNKFIIGGIYRHPGYGVEEFTCEMEKCLSKIASQSCPCIIAGDINIDLSKSLIDSKTADYVSNLLLNNFFPTIVMPTRITSRTATLIDHVYYYEGKAANRGNLEIHSGNFIHDLTDHLPNYLLLVNKGKITIKEPRPYIRIYSDKNKIKFLEEIRKPDWSNVYNQNDVNLAYDNFIHIIETAFENCFPLQQLSRKRMKDKPWITSGLKKSSVIKNNLYKKWILTRLPEDEKKYKNYRRVFKKTALEAENEYFKNKFDTKANSVKKLWSNLNTVCSISKKKSMKNIINVLNVNGCKIEDKNDICNSFNNYFATLGDTLVEQLPNPGINTFEDYLPQATKNSIFCSPTDKYEISNLIHKLKNNKSPGPDNIGPSLVKEMEQIIIDPLAYIFNLSLSTGQVPSKLKIAKVIPVYKKGKVDVLSNYRPISLLSIFDKLLEKIICTRLSNFLSANNTLYEYQFGFRKLHSINLALIDVVDNILQHLDIRDCGVGVCIDLQKAFDTVNHDILLRKLDRYGIRGVMYNWIRDYLTDRQQYVSIQNSNSLPINITCGVPQGSVLGPLLFLLYVNDIGNVLPSRSVKLYADDTNIFIFNKDITTVSIKANEYMSRLSQWFIVNRLSLNRDKTCFMTFATKNQDDPVIVIENTKILNVKQCKYLGVCIDNDLKWTEHINLLCDRLKKYVGIFYRLRTKLQQQCLKTLYFAFVYPHLLHGIEVYANTGVTHLTKLITLNNKILRILQNKPYNTPVIDLYTAYNTLPIPQLHSQQLLLLVHKCIYHKHLLPKMFLDYFHDNQSVYTYDTRNKTDLYMLSVNTTFGQRCVKFKGASLWNDLPPFIKNITSINKFKTTTKSYLLTLNI